MIYCVGRKWKNSKVTYFVWTNIFFFVAVLLARIFLRSKQCRLSHSIYWNYHTFTLNLLNPCLSQPLSSLNSCSINLYLPCIAHPVWWAEWKLKKILMTLAIPLLHNGKSHKKIPFFLWTPPLAEIIFIVGYFKVCFQ